MTKRILIADDHISVLRAIKTAVAAHPDWEVCGEAADGQEAVDKATELDPDLVVLDLAMPRLDGLEAAKEIHKRLPHVPLILHTLYKPAGPLAERCGIRKITEKGKPDALILAIEELLNTGVAGLADMVPPSGEPSQAPSSPVSDPNLVMQVAAAPAVPSAQIRETPSTAVPPDIIKAD